MQAIEPYTGLGFAFFAAIAAPHRVRLRAAVPLTALLLAALPLVSYLTGFDMAAAWGMTAGMAYTVVFSFLIWHVSTTKRQAVEVAEARAGEAVLQERARLAREVHDILAHAQSAQIVHLEGARVLLRTGADPALALDRVERAVHLARVGLEETRRALDTLRGRDLPLPERLERLAAEFRATTGASCVLTVDPGAAGLSAEAKLAVARTAQEALTNVRKHAPGAPAEVSLRLLGRWCELEIRDGGAPAARLPGPGLFDAGSPPGNGPALSNGSAQQGNGIGHTTDWPHSSGSDGPRSSGDADIGGVRDGVGEGAVEPGGRMAARSGAGYGLIGMRERAELIGGSLTAGGRRRRVRGGAAGAGMTVRVLVADDQTVVREGLVLLLGLLPDTEVVGAAGDGEEAVRLVAELAPDVVLMDLRMPRMDGVAATRIIRREHPRTEVVVLSTYSDDESVFAALRAGARGYLTKDTDAESLARAISVVADGEAHFAPPVQRRLAETVAGGPGDREVLSSGAGPGIEERWGYAAPGNAHAGGDGRGFGAGGGC
ncbi:response regulator [Nonomuraea ferruginea]